jgi:hypothetical protein
MRVLSFLAARGGLLATLMMALAVLATPTQGLADAPDAHPEIAVGADSHGASAGHAAHDDTLDRSCHPDPTCSPAAILMTRPIFKAQGFSSARQLLAGTTRRGRIATVDLPPPRPWAVSRPNSLNDTQT